MAQYKCKMCGGALEINDETVVTCEYCGTQQTLPRLDSERRANLYERANHFRRNNEFDKAMEIYEQILNEDNKDSEAYWSLILCRYGIKYVEDPTSHKRIPTVNRAQFTSIFDDDNYKAALQYADGYQRSIYEEEAKAINEIQKGILAISQNEDPFDVFICYKETDSDGRRTPDSVLANDLYHQLTREGFKVFFARITLEDKLGSAYEPYIFAALNSAKVMVVLGTRPEYFNAVWVKNEWSRYLSLIRNGANKMLIPAYRDMDPYDLPEEFSHLQAQDMSKLGFMQDLIRGIKKVIDAQTPAPSVVKETVTVGGNATAVDPLLERVFLFLEDGNWQSADEYCEKVLDIAPQNAKAYLGKLMVERRAKRQEDLKNCQKPFDDSVHYNKILRFADPGLKATLAEYLTHINIRNESARMEEHYFRATEAMNSAKTKSEYLAAAAIFCDIADYKDSSIMAEECRTKAKECMKLEEIAQKDKILADGKAKMSLNSISYYEEAISLFESIPGWKDADEQIPVCRSRIAKLRVIIEEKKIKAEIDRKDAALARGKARMDGKTTADYNDAIKIFESISGWKDADEKIAECNEKIEEIKASEEAARIEQERKNELLRKEGIRRNKHNGCVTLVWGIIELILCVVSFILCSNFGSSGTSAEISEGITGLFVAGLGSGIISILFVGPGLLCTLLALLIRSGGVSTVFKVFYWITSSGVILLFGLLAFSGLFLGEDAVSGLMGYWALSVAVIYMVSFVTLFFHKKPIKVKAQASQK